MKDEKEKFRDVYIRVSYAKDEYEKVKKKSDNVGLTPSQYVRSVSLTSKFGRK